MTDSTALVPVAPLAAPAPVLAPATSADVYASLDAKTDKARIINLLQGKAELLAEHVNESIAIEHVLAHRVSSEDIDEATGEILGTKELTRIVLLTPDGQAFQAAGEGIKRSIQLLAGFFGMPPWKPALKVKVQLIRTRRGRTTYALQLEG